MASYTQHFNLTKLGPSDGVHAAGDTFATSDRDTIDRTLQAAVTHRHDGAGAGSTGPELPPILTLSPTGGSLPAGVTLRYKYTLVDPATGESVASPEASVTTPTAISSPTNATFVVQQVGGTLEPGQYFYTVTAYQGSTTVETTASQTLSVQIPAGSNSNSVAFNLGALPSGASGYNVYRRAPNETRYHYLGSVTSGSFTDDGSLTAADRAIPTTNSTNGTSSVTVEIPVGLAVGDWSIYRSTSGDFSSSFLVQLPHTQYDYIDVGNGTQAGSPPTAMSGLGNPAKINLTNGAEVDGTLPMGLTSFPFQVHFQIAGPLIATFEGSAEWVSMFPQAQLRYVQLALGRGSKPDAQYVKVNVLRGSSYDVDPEYDPLFPTNYLPSIPTGWQRGPRYAVNTSEAHLYQGESLTVDLVQIGGGAGTDRDLTITVSMIAYGFDPSSFEPIVSPYIGGSF